MDQLIREATDIFLHLRNLNMEESLSLSRLRNLSFTPCKKGSKKVFSKSGTVSPF
jgi:hypothetical protein